MQNMTQTAKSMDARDIKYKNNQLTKKISFQQAIMETRPLAKGCQSKDTINPWRYDRHVNQTLQSCWPGLHLENIYLITSSMSAYDDPLTFLHQIQHICVDFLNTGRPAKNR